MVMKCTEFPLSTIQPSALHVNDLTGGCKARSQLEQTQVGLIPKFTGLLPGDPITVSQPCREGGSADFYFKEQTIILSVAVGLGASQVALMVENPPAGAGETQEMWFGPQSQKIPGEGQPTPAFLLGGSHGLR